MQCLHFNSLTTFLKLNLKLSIYCSEFSDMSTIVEMMVHMDCPGCESKIKKVLQRLEGVDSVKIDMGLQKVTVIEWADQEKILKTARRNGRQAGLWPLPDTQEECDHNYNNDQYQHHNNATNYNQYQHHNNPTTNYLSFYNIEYTYAYDYSDSTHYEHEHEHGYYGQPAQSKMLDREASTYFSDENTSACSTM